MLQSIRNILFSFRFIILVGCMMIFGVLAAYPQLSRSMFMLSNVNHR